MYPSDPTSLLAAARTDASSSMIEITGANQSILSILASTEQSVSALRQNAPRRSGGKSYLGFDALRLRATNSEHFGHSDQIGQRPRTHFSHDVPPVNLDGNLS